MEIQGSVALVTGGAKRIGRVIATHLAGRGATVAVHYHDSAREAKETIEAIREAGGMARAYGADFRDQGAVQGLLPRVAEALGTINILVNGASAFRQVDLPGTTRADIEESLAIHLWAPLRLSQAMLERLGDAPGKIINVNDARQVRPNQFAYGVGKAALSGLTRSLAAAAGPNVQVNEIALGAVLPPEGISPQRVEQLARSSPAKRLGALEEVAHLVETLIVNDFINGESIHLDGGRTGTRH